jgi:hypothetical protein
MRQLFWYGVFGYGAGEADFYLGGPNDAILISGGNFEGSARLLETTGASANPFPVTIQGVRWSGDGLAADGKAIIAARAAQSHWQCNRRISEQASANLHQRLGSSNCCDCDRQ